MFYEVGQHIRQRWKVLRILRGRLGAVYLALDGHAQRPVLLKPLETGDGETLARWRQWLRPWLAMPPCAHTVAALDVHAVESHILLRAEAVAGMDLWQWWMQHSGPAADPAAMRCRLDLAIGLARALWHGSSHFPDGHGRVHPRNCLLDATGQLRLTDWYARSGVNTNAAAPGSPGPPERPEPSLAAGSGAAPVHVSGDIDAAPWLYDPPPTWPEAQRGGVSADMYAFGLILHRLLTGHLPGRAESLLPRDEPLDERMLAAAALPAAVPGSLDELLRACLRLGRQQPEDFGQVLSALVGSYEHLYATRPGAMPRDEALAAQRWWLDGRTLLDHGHHAEALRCFERATTGDPRLRDAWFDRGRTLMALRQAHSAVHCFDHLLEIDGGDVEALFEKAMALLQHGSDTAEATACLEQAACRGHGQAAQWVERLKTTIEAPSPPRQPSHPATAQDQPGPFVHAHSGAVDSPGRYLERGGEMLASRQYDAALGCFERVLGMDDRQTTAWVGKAAALLALHRVQEAMLSLNMALTIAPDCGPAWAHKAAAHAAHAEHLEALTCFERALKHGAAATLRELDLPFETAGPMHAAATSSTVIGSAGGPR